MVKEQKNRRIKLIPVLPSILTLGNAACGVIALLSVFQYTRAYPEGGAVEYLNRACWLVFAAMLFDVLDGKVARSMHTESQFGRELDSLADIISFGVVPAVISYSFIRSIFAIMDKNISTNEVWLVSGISVVFVVCAVLRLARYNVETDGTAHSTLSGLPTPGAAAFVISNILFFNKYLLHGLFADSLGGFGYVTHAFFPFAVLVSGVLMVSRIEFLHLGNILTERMRTFSFLAVSVFFSLLIIWKPVEMLFAISWIYLLRGVIPGIVMYIRHGKTMGLD